MIGKCLRPFSSRCLEPVVHPSSLLHVRSKCCIKRFSRAFQWGHPITAVYIALSSGLVDQPCRKGTNMSIARTLPAVASCRHARTGGQRNMSERLFGYARVSVASDADANNLENQRRVLVDCEQVFEDVGSGASWNRPG